MEVLSSNNNVSYSSPAKTKLEHSKSELKNGFNYSFYVNNDDNFETDNVFSDFVEFSPTKDPPLTTSDGSAVAGVVRTSTRLREKRKDLSKSYLNQVRELIKETIEDLGPPAFLWAPKVIPGEAENSSVHSSICSSFCSRDSETMSIWKDDQIHLVNILSLRVWSDKMRFVDNDVTRLKFENEREKLRVVAFTKFYMAQFPYGYCREKCDAQIS